MLLEKVFLIFALIGGGLFVARLALQFAGFDHHTDHDTIDVDSVDSVHSDTDLSFKILTLQGLTAFFMMFGLAGYVFVHEYHWKGLAVLAATASGLMTVLIMQQMFKLAGHMQSSGTVDNEATVGSHGTVYLRLPGANGIGKVMINVKDRLREYDAVAQEPIHTGESIRVTGVIEGGSILVVAREVH